MAEPIQVEPFVCDKCAGKLNLYTGDESQTIVCQYCGAVFDLQSEDGKRVAKYREKIAKIKPDIPLGITGSLNGETVTVIGFLVREITVDGARYRWREYLLVTPEGEFRWLTEYDGHWTFARTVTDIPKVLSTGKARHRDLDFDHFQTADATVVGVLGEFYWHVKVGEQVNVADYVSPPFILSSETTKKEMSWSLGKYMAPEDVWAAFKLTIPVKVRVGVFANQPNPYEPFSARTRFMGLLFCAAAIGLYVFFSAIAKNKNAAVENFTYAATDAEKSRVGNVFPLEGHRSNVLLRISTNLDNQWAFFSMALINADNDEALDFGKEISYYHGVDSDGSWSEGSNYGEIFLPTIPEGHYYLRIEPETNAVNFSYSVGVIRDAPRPLYLLIVLLLLAVPVLWIELCKFNFESQRWSESDHPWTSADGDDDD